MFRNLFRSAKGPNRPRGNGGQSVFKKILHANDGSDHAFNALALAIQLARQYGADLHMVCVGRDPVHA
jgi:nucleotide-binding universal stress UspA family protein